MPGKFVPLHVHSEYSALDGTIRIPKLVEWCASNGVSHAVVTDHGMMSGSVDLHSSAKKDVVPGFGCELYSRSLVYGDRPGIHHLLAIAKNAEGYKNLMRIMSAAHSNFNRKPLLTLDILKGIETKSRRSVDGIEVETTVGDSKISTKGIVFSTACVQGELSQLILAKDFDGAKRFLETLRTLSPDVYVELPDVGAIDVGNGMTQIELNRVLYDFAHANGYPVIMTNDAHYFPEDREWHPKLMQAQLTRKDEEETESKRQYLEHMKLCDISLRSPTEMWERWGNDYPDALENTVRIADSIERFDIASPNFLLPAFEQKKVENLAGKARSMLDRRLDDMRIGNPQTRAEYESRLDYEMSVVQSMGFGNYFLMVENIVSSARSKGIAVGPGRGSAAGSLLAWSLGITQVDPIRYGLLFERFLNPDRISMPDIDVDIEDARRGEVLEHLRESYGSDSVCGIVNYARPKWKNALRDAARVLKHKTGPGEPGDKFVRLLSPVLVDDNVSESDVMDYIKRENISCDMNAEQQANVVSLADKFRGIIRHYGKHACGIVIAHPDVRNWVPLCRVGGKDGDLISQYNMSGVEYLKLVKMDILGLSTLTDLKNTVRMAGEFRECETPDEERIYAILNEKGHEDLHALQSKYIPEQSIDRTERLLGDGDTTGVFQLESSGMRKLLNNIKPQNIQELSALVSLYRPGPLGGGIADAYVEAGLGKGNDKNPFPESMRDVIASVASDSKGLVIYQEQVMKVAREVAGYTLGQADLLRRAMGKKKHDVMQSERKRFVDGAVAKGFNADDANTTFDVLEYFSGYGFNKSHATAYAFLAYATAWYKACRPAAFHATLLGSKFSKEKLDDMGPFIREVGDLVKIRQPAFTEIGQKLSSIRNIRILFNDESYEKTHLAKNSDDMWRTESLWNIFLGVGNIGGLGEKTIDRIGEFQCPSSVHGIFEQLWSPEWSVFSPLVAAKLFCAGTFDLLVEGKLEELRSSGKIKKNIRPRHIRTMLLASNAYDFFESDEYISQSAFLLCAPLLSSRSGDIPDKKSVFERLSKEGREFFPSLMSFVIGSIRKKLSLKKKPWGDIQLDEYREKHLMPGIDLLFEGLSKQAERTVSDREFALDCMSYLYQGEATNYGEGISTSSWKLASEIVGRGFIGYADEIHVFRRELKGFSSYDESPDCFPSVIAEAFSKGAWILGYPLGTGAGKRGMFCSVSGRFGDSKYITYFNIPPDRAGCVPEITRSKGDISAFRVTFDGKGFVLDEFRRIELLRAHDPIRTSSDVQTDLLPVPEGAPKIFRFSNSEIRRGLPSWMNDKTAVGRCFAIITEDQQRLSDGDVLNGVREIGSTQSEKANCSPCAEREDVNSGERTI